VNAPRLTLVLLLLAAAVYLGVTRPAAQDLAALSDEYSKARDVQVTRQARLADIEHRERERRQALALLAGAQTRSLPAVRRRLLGRLSGLPLTDIHLDIGAAAAPAFAEVKVATQGDFFSLMALSSRLAQADAGLAFRQISFTRSERDERVRLTLTADTVAGQP
jgi:hypothetical protein